MLPSNVPASDLALLPSDLVMVLIKSLPVGVREYAVVSNTLKLVYKGDIKGGGSA